MSSQQQPKEIKIRNLEEADPPVNKNFSFEPMKVLRTDVHWYKVDIGSRLKPATREFYRTYSSIADDEIVNHLHSIRDRAWPFAEYPCVGQWMFLLPSVSIFSEYENVLLRVKTGASVLDLGCSFGQDLRRLAAAGAPTENMYASDLNSELWNIGFDLFRDRQRMKARFIQSDIFDRASELGDLKAKIDIFIVCQFLHLFSWEKQFEAVKRIVEMSRPGSQLIGYQMGRLKAEESHTRWNTMFFHNVETFKRMWCDIEKETGTKWRVKVALVDLEELGMEKEDYDWMAATQRGLKFSVTRQDDYEPRLSSSL